MAFYDAMVLVRFRRRQKPSTGEELKFWEAKGSHHCPLICPYKKGLIFWGGGWWFGIAGLPLDSHDCRTFFGSDMMGNLGEFSYKLAQGV